MILLLRYCSRAKPKPPWSSYRRKTRQNHILFFIPIHFLYQNIHTVTHSTPMGHENLHYSDVAMSMMASQITSVAIVYSIVCSGADQRKHQSSTSLAFVREIHRWPVNSPHKGPVMRKMFPFHDIVMYLPHYKWWFIFSRSQNLEFANFVVIVWKFQCGVPSLKLAWICCIQKILFSISFSFIMTKILTHKSCIIQKPISKVQFLFG